MSELPLNDRIALVVGASRGIGLEFARQYRAEGAQVDATARDDAGRARLQALGARALTLDVTEADAAARLAAQVAGRAFDLVVLNAGVYGPRLDAPNAPEAADFDHVMRTNVLGPMRLLPVAAGALAPGARLAVLSSIMGSIGQRSNGGAWLYRASKAALNSVLKDASFALAGRALCVSLHPGWVRTDMGGAGAALDVADSVAAMRRTIGALSAGQHGAFLDHDGAPLPW